MPRPQSTIPLLAWISLWVAITAAGLIAWPRYQRNSQEKSESEHTKRVDAVMQKQADDLLLRNQQLRARAREAAARRKLEFETALGGPAPAAFKNPDYPLRQALYLAAVNCAPTNTAVQIEVDRFTEFSVSISSPEALTTNEMTAVARCFLPLAHSYVDNVRFSVRGSIIAELDRGDIDLIEDWSRVPADRAAKLLARETPTAPADTGAVERLRQEQKVAQILAADEGARAKVAAADKKFAAATQKAYEDLNAALTLSHKATLLDNVQRVRDIDNLNKTLRDAADRASAAKQFWSDPAKNWRVALEAENMQPAAMDALIEAFPRTWRQDPARVAKVLQALDGEIESARYFLKIAGEQFGKWNFHPETGQYGFTDEEYSKRFLRAQQQLREDSQNLDAALRAWNDSVGL